MLTPYAQPQLVEKIFTDPTGRQFRLVFLVALVNGELKGRLVSAQPVKSSNEIRDKRYEKADILLLPTASPKIISHTSYLLSPALFVSPFSELLFFTSQPTRAPSK